MKVSPTIMVPFLLEKKNQDSTSDRFNFIIWASLLLTEAFLKTLLKSAPGTNDFDEFPVFPKNPFLKNKMNFSVFHPDEFQRREITLFVGNLPTTCSSR